MRFNKSPAPVQLPISKQLLRAGRAEGERDLPRGLHAGRPDGALLGVDLRPVPDDPHLLPDDPHLEPAEHSETDPDRGLGRRPRGGSAERGRHEASLPLGVRPWA